MTRVNLLLPRNMPVAQNNQCAICLQPETAKNRVGAVRRLSVDHDHVTGRIRGLLCSRCNAAIGHFDDDPVRLASAVRYLGGGPP